MRSVCFVKRLQWDVPGTVLRHGMTIGDVDNDGENELVVGTAEGELYIFKGTELWQKIKISNCVTCVAIGDIFNYGRNALVVICGDGWVYIYYGPRSVNPSINNMNTPGSGHVLTKKTARMAGVDQVDSISETSETSGKMECVHIQRIPTNTKVVLIADVDKDNANEMIIGLTDRVVRSYRWSSNVDLGPGKLVGLNKWESANQIGSVTLQHTSSGTPILLVAQPGGTFMRIKCDPDDGPLDDPQDTNSEVAASYVDYQYVGVSRMRNPETATEILGDLEIGQNESLVNKSEGVIERDSTDEILETHEREDNSESIDQVDGNLVGGNVILGEFETSLKKKSLLPSYGDFTPRKLKNYSCDDIKVENTKKEDFQNSVEEFSNSDGKPFALATLDGTIMLMKGDSILWEIQVDNQILALCQLDFTQDGADEIVVCTWDGQTYILDQQKNCVRFQFDEPVQAFCTGMYNLSAGASTACFVYNTFANKVYLYYDVSLRNMVLHNFVPQENLNPREKIILDKILGTEKNNENSPKLLKLTEWLLYSAK